MKKLILLLLTILSIISCSEAVQAERIPLTSSSDEAKALLNQVLVNWEERNWGDHQEILLKKIDSLDPNFYMSNLFWNNIRSGEENRLALIDSYNNLDKVSEVEAGIIKANYERRINGSVIKQDEIFDALILKFPQYYQLRLWSGDVKSRIDPFSAEKRWKEAAEINPDSFDAYFSLSTLHFSIDVNDGIFAPEDRDLKEAEAHLFKSSDLRPKSDVPYRFLGNVYRAMGDFEKAEEAYKKSLSMLINKTDNRYANSLLMVGHVSTFQGKYNEGRSFYDQALAISNEYQKVSYSVLKSHTYIYQKDFANAVSTISEAQSKIDSYDIPEADKLWLKNSSEFAKFLAFGHSQKEEETIGSLNEMNLIRSEILKIRLASAVDEEEKERLTLNDKANSMSFDVWFNILFGKYEAARDLLVNFRTLSERRLAYNAKAMNQYNSLSGYLNLMEGEPQEAINSYAKVPKEALGDDNYHQYFLALANKAVGKEEESKKMFVDLANNNFASWQNSIVKNLAKAQIKTNL